MKTYKIHAVNDYDGSVINTTAGEANVSEFTAWMHREGYVIKEQIVVDPGKPKEQPTPR